MNEFVKPKTQIISDSEYIQSLVNANLRKDLHDNEEICEHCHGTGLVITNNPYGLKEESYGVNSLFPYMHQAITFCPHCYNGIIHRCKLCGQIMPKGLLRHNCEQQLAIEKEKLLQRKLEEFQKAPIAPDKIVEDCYYLYSEDYPYNNGYFSEWEEFFDAWYDNNDVEDDKPEYVWITEGVEMHIDADYIVECATEELYEDAKDNVSDTELKELQDFLDDWCRRCGVGTTYYENHKYKVRIPWEEAAINK